MTETTEPEESAAKTLPEALGAYRIAEALAEHSGAEVTAGDVHELVKRELLAGPVDYYKRHPLFSTAAALALEPEVVREVVEERTAWLAASVTRDEAAERIGWHWRDLARMAEEGRITTGRGGRYLTADVDRLAAEADGEQRITASAAAEELEIRPTDFRYVEAAGWLTPVEILDQPVGRERTVEVALYRLADVRAVREMPGVAWEEVRGLPKGAPSPLREYAALAPDRATVVKGFAQALADRHQVHVWAWHSPYTGGWELDWERRDDATPTVAQVRTEMAEDAAVAAYAGEITLCPVWGRITREARALLEPDVAVVLDTETTSLAGQAIEIAVLDAHSGKIKMDTLVKPTEPISRGATWVHGLTDADVAHARPFEKVLRRLRDVTRDRVIIAYNEEFDRETLTGDIERCGRRPMHLGDPGSWWCLMKAYAEWLGSPRWLRLGGKHRAAGDCAAARTVLVEISHGRGTEFSPAAPGPGDPVAGWSARPVCQRQGDALESVEVSGD